MYCEVSAVAGTTVTMGRISSLMTRYAARITTAVGGVKHVRVAKPAYYPFTDDNGFVIRIVVERNSLEALAADLRAAGCELAWVVSVDRIL